MPFKVIFYIPIGATHKGKNKLSMGSIFSLLLVALFKILFSGFGSRLICSIVGLSVQITTY